jgi:hypothetical protein
MFFNFESIFNFVYVQVLEAASPLPKQHRRSKCLSTILFQLRRFFSIICFMSNRYLRLIDPFYVSKQKSNAVVQPSKHESKQETKEVKPVDKSKKFVYPEAEDGCKRAYDAVRLHISFHSGFFSCLLLC